MAMDDPACMHALRTSESPISRGLARPAVRRRLYKRGAVCHDRSGEYPCVPCRCFNKGRPGLCRTDRGNGRPAAPRGAGGYSRPSRGSCRLAYGEDQHEVVNLEEFSPRIRTLNATRREQWRLGVYTLPEHRESVAEAGCAVLHLKNLPVRIRCS